MPEPTEQMVEAGARAICTMDADYWENIETPYVRWYNNAARACLTAALTADPRATAVDAVVEAARALRNGFGSTHAWTGAQVRLATALAALDQAEGHQ